VPVILLSALSILLHLNLITNLKSESLGPIQVMMTCPKSQGDLIAELRVFLKTSIFKKKKKLVGGGAGGEGERES